MAKNKAGQLPTNMINKTIPNMKSTEEMTKEVVNNMEEKSILEIVSEQENEVAITVEEVESKDESKEEIKEVIIDTSNIKTAKAFDKILSKEVKKPKKEKTMIYLEENTMKQFKTLSMTHKVSLAKLFEIACTEYIKGQEIDETLVAKYDEINKAKGRRKNNK